MFLIGVIILITGSGVIDTTNKCFAEPSVAAKHVVELNSLTTRDENSWIANSVDLDEVAHNEPPHLDLHYLPSSLWILYMI